jgi:broad specificity phosphatase PhoE
MTSPERPANVARSSLSHGTPRRRFLARALAVPAVAGLAAATTPEATAAPRHPGWVAGRPFKAKDLVGKALYAARHAVTEANKQARDYLYAPTYEVVTAPILPEGEAPSRLLGAYFGRIGAAPVEAWSSEYSRCAQTAALITEGSGRTIEFKFDPRLNDFHKLKNLSFEQLTEQTLDLLAEIAGSAPRHVLLLSHGGNIAAITAAVVRGGFTREDFDNRALRPSPAQMVILRKGDANEVTRYP